MTDFGIQEEHSLDIAFKATDGMWYGWNNDNYNAQDFRRTEHELCAGEISVTVQLVAPWVNELFGFTFDTRGNDVKILLDAHSR
jgi:hypothetical protein